MMITDTRLDRCKTMPRDALSRLAFTIPDVPQAICWMALTSALIILIFGRPQFPFDDGYITLHNARTLLGGGSDPTYAGASALTGTTSAVHLALIAAVGSILPLETAGRLVTLGCALLYAAALDRIAVRERCSRFALIVIGLVTGYQSIQICNGLETALSAAAIGWALVLCNSIWLPLLCGVMPFIRPELAMLGIPMIARLCWRERQSPETVARIVLLVVLGAAPWMLMYQVVTGSPMPLTGQAKILFFAEANRPMAWKLGAFWFAVKESWLLPLAIGTIGLARTSAGRCALGFLAVWLSLAYLEFPGGLSHNHSRYLTDAVPVLLFGMAPLMAHGSIGANLSRALVAWAAATGVYLYPHRDDLAAARNAMVETLAHQVPRDARVAVHDAGYVAWRLPELKLTDVVGLKSPASLSVWQRLHPDAQDRGKALGIIMRQSRSEYFVVLTSDPFWRGLATALHREGWAMIPVNKGAYTVFRLRAP